MLASEGGERGEYCCDSIRGGRERQSITVIASDTALLPPLWARMQVVRTPPLSRQSSAVGQSKTYSPHNVEDSDEDDAQDTMGDEMQCENVDMEDANASMQSSNMGREHGADRSLWESEVGVAIRAFGTPGGPMFLLVRSNPPAYVMQKVQATLLEEGDGQDNGGFARGYEFVECLDSVASDDPSRYHCTCDTWKSGSYIPDVTPSAAFGADDGEPDVGPMENELMEPDDHVSISGETAGVSRRWCLHTFTAAVINAQSAEPDGERGGGVRGETQLAPQTLANISFDVDHGWCLPLWALEDQQYPLAGCKKDSHSRHGQQQRADGRQGRADVHWYLIRLEVSVFLTRCDHTNPVLPLSP